MFILSAEVKNDNQKLLVSEKMSQVFSVGGTVARCGCASVCSCTRIWGSVYPCVSLEFN